MRNNILLIFSTLMFVTIFKQVNAKQAMVIDKNELTDAELVKKLPGFKNGYTEVNGVKLHYVEGGNGMPLVLLPGWPETWWSYRKMMPLLAGKYHVIVIDMRGMGSSGK